jgi:hypothetical protein
MIVSQNRTELRKTYAAAWRKHTAGEVLSPLEIQIVRVVEEHPEFHDAVTGDLERDFSIDAGRANPFLHMGLHLGLREQIATNRPPGIAAVFDTLAARAGDAHEAEHRMIDCLAEILWEAQRAGQAPDEAAYLHRLRLL